MDTKDMLNQILIMRVYVSCYKISFEREVKKGEIDLHSTVSSIDPPGLSLVLSMGFGPLSVSALPGNPHSVWPFPPG